MEWLDVLCEAGAKSVVSLSDQFLGRTIFPDVREEMLEIMKGVRERN